MSILLRILQFILWVVILGWLVRIVSGWFGWQSALRRQQSRQPRLPARPEARLVRDPVCGTHVSAEISYTLEQSGHVIHFCSAECRERYRDAQRRVAGG